MRLRRAKISVHLYYKKTPFKENTFYKRAEVNVVAEEGQDLGGGG